MCPLQISKWLFAPTWTPTKFGWCVLLWVGLLSSSAQQLSPAAQLSSSAQQLSPSAELSSSIQQLSSAAQLSSSAQLTSSAQHLSSALQLSSSAHQLSTPAQLSSWAHQLSSSAQLSSAPQLIIRAPSNTFRFSEKTWWQLDLLGYGGRSGPESRIQNPLPLDKAKLDFHDQEISKLRDLGLAGLSLSICT